MRIAYRPVRNLIFLIIIGSIIYYLFHIWGKHMDTRIKEGYTKFDKSELKGRLEKTAIKFHMISFQLQGVKEEYLFDPNISSDEHIFNGIAERGDSIVKSAYSDTLLLKKGTKIYAFTFRNLLKD